MVFSDTTNKNGIIQQIEFNTNLGDAGISGNAVLLKQMTAKINTWYYKATKIILTADGRWKWDDANHSNSPTATASLVTDQGDYQLMDEAPSAGKDWLQIERVEMKDNNGNWILLKERNLRRVRHSISEERLTSGVPRFYDFDGASIFLDAIPNYDSANGLRIWFSRNPLEFTSADTPAATTKRPGFNTMFHEYLVLGPQYDWEKVKGVGNPEQTMRDIDKMEIDMAKFYGTRDQAVPTIVRRAYNSFR